MKDAQSHVTVNLEAKTQKGYYQFVYVVGASFSILIVLN